MATVPIEYMPKRRELALFSSCCLLFANAVVCVRAFPGSPSSLLRRPPLPARLDRANALRPSGSHCCAVNLASGRYARTREKRVVPDLKRCAARSIGISEVLCTTESLTIVFDEVGQEFCAPKLKGSPGCGFVSAASRPRQMRSARFSWNARWSWLSHYQTLHGKGL